MTVLQGTDGVRGTVSLDTDTRKQDSIRLFTEENIITPEFVFRYVTGFCRYLIAQQWGRPGNRIVLGWDPRDREGWLCGAAVEATRKSGFEPVVGGCLPTPAIALSMLSLEANGGVVITASHNPSRYNGVKLFLPVLGVKPYPADDVLISGYVRTTPDPEPGSFQALADPFHADPGMLAMYTGILKQNSNSWMGTDQSVNGSLKIVIDTAHGAMSQVAAGVFAGIPNVEVIPVNDDYTGLINEDGGVLMIDEIPNITRDEFFDQNSNLTHHRGLKTVFHVARDTRQHPECTVCGASFDGDGDRFLFYYCDPDGEKVHILNGDRMSELLTRFLMKKTNPERIYRITTIESSLSTAVSATEMQIRYERTGVGDKWVTWKAWDTLFLETESHDNLRSEIQPCAPDYRSLRTTYEHVTGTGALIGENLVNGQVSIIGSETSGHLITPVFLQTVSGTPVVTFCGDGLKGLMNVLAVWNVLDTSQSRCEDRHGVNDIAIRRYCYYADKSCLAKGSNTRLALMHYVHNAIQSVFGSNIRIKPLELREEPDMIFFNLSSRNDDTLMGSLYIRNSGTEPKTGIHAKGWQNQKTLWEELVNRIHLHLMVTLKSAQDPMVKIQWLLLNLIQKNPRTMGDIMAMYPELPCETVLRDSERYENLVTRTGEHYTLTNQGKNWLRQFTLEEKNG